MKTTTTFAASLILPLFLLACSPSDQSPSAAANSGEDKSMAATPSEQIENAPPAAGLAMPPDEQQPPAGAGAMEEPTKPATPVPDQPATDPAAPAQ
jgi:hypothetical protein